MCRLSFPLSPCQSCVLIWKNNAYSTGMNSNVISVPNVSLPIMEAASEPNMASGSNGIMPRIVVSAAIDTGRKRLCELSIKAFIGSTPD